MPVMSKADELLNYVRPFRVGSGRLPSVADSKTIERLAHGLKQENPAPALDQSLGCLAGLWECIFTSSRFVLGLDRMPFVRTSAVYQQMVIHPDGRTGHYFNIAELSRGGAVKCVCGEFATVRSSQSHLDRLEVQYEWFYFAMRVLSRYEGHVALAGELQAQELPRSVRLPFHGCGWQSTLYLDGRMRVVEGNKGGLFILLKRG